MTSSAASDIDRARNATVGATGSHLLEHRSPTAARHVHVEEHHVRSALEDQLDRGADLVGLTDDVDRVPQLGPDPGPHQGVVVHDEHPQPRRSGHVDDTGRGRTSSTSVPSPGTLWTATLPPARSIRSTIEWAIP